MFAHMNDAPTDGWTVDDLDALPEDGARRELIDGILHVTPSPAPTHQVLAARLLVALEETCPEHLHVSQANDVVLSMQRLFTPDVLVTTDEAAARDRRFIAKEVVLAVEIVSPGSQSMDRVMKPALYAKAGIPFYWLIERSGGLVVHAFRLADGDDVYQPVGVFTETIKLDQPWGIEIPVARLRPRHL
ncbi:Uma2 family endonuclease [Actinoplanes sp. HUAS TT8]|uniref:Uma2 family endonuclease n=1 Tax=Actinoplanes sp. HUAS TT8 TaxID=3447453 RepID=UPI003F51F554